jgi:hypothetical protein
LVAVEVNATRLPSALIAVRPTLPAFAWLPSVATLTRSVTPVAAAAAPASAAATTRTASAPSFGR